MRTVLALLLGLSFIAGCESAKREPTDVFDGGEPLYIAECQATARAGLRVEQIC